MFKRSMITLIVLVFVTLPFAMAMAEGAPGGNPKKGKFLYRSKLHKPCFQAGEAESKTPTISPADKKRAEWKDIFENKKYDQLGCVKFWEALSEDKVLDIHSYFYEYAADSPKPATCK